MWTTSFCSSFSTCKAVCLSHYRLMKWSHAPSSLLESAATECASVLLTCRILSFVSCCQWNSWQFLHNNRYFSFLSLLRPRRCNFTFKVYILSFRIQTTTVISVMLWLDQPFTSSSRLYLFMFYFLSFVNIWRTSMAYYIRVCRRWVYILFLMKNKTFPLAVLWVFM